jgi:DNA-binding SARP family transcriptional activator
MSAQRLLAFLALRGRPIQRVYVAGSLWLDATEDRSGASLRSVLWRLHRPGLELVEATVTHLGLARDVIVDIRRTTSIADRLLNHPDDCSDDDWDDAPFNGELLPDWDEDWVLLEQERWHQLRLHVLEAICERMIEIGRFGQAVDAGLSAVRGEPLRESAHRVLIKAHLAEGNPCEAIGQYRRYRRILHDELGLQPSRQLTDLMQGLTA